MDLIKKGKYSTCYEYIVAREYDGKNVYTFLEDNYNYSSRTFRNIIKEGRLLVNNKDVFFTYVLKEKDEIKVYFPMEYPDSKGQDIDIDVIYEDEDILVINKKPGIVVHKTKSYPIINLSSGIYNMWEKRGCTGKVRFVNRLDMDTSGIVVVAKNKYVHHFISDQNINSQIDKYYEAIVEGVLLKDRGEICAPIKREEDYSIKRVVREDGKYCLTEYEVLEKFKEASLLRLKLITGRTHQIRVHLNHIGHSIIGDSLYNENKSNIIFRQALHAKEISFIHPRTLKKVTFTGDRPKDFTEAIDFLRSS